MTKYKPLGDRVLIKRLKAKTTKGGIFLPDTAQEKPKEGIVIAIGPGKLDENGKMEEIPVKINDRVLFGSYAGTEVKGTNEEDEEYLILKVDEILGVLV